MYLNTTFPNPSFPITNPQACFSQFGCIPGQQYGQTFGQYGTPTFGGVTNSWANRWTNGLQQPWNQWTAPFNYGPINYGYTGYTNFSPVNWTGTPWNYNTGWNTGWNGYTTPWQNYFQTQFQYPQLQYPQFSQYPTNSFGATNWFQPTFSNTYGTGGVGTGCPFLASAWHTAGWNPINWNAYPTNTFGYNTGINFGNPAGITPSITNQGIGQSQYTGQVTGQYPIQNNGQVSPQFNGQYGGQFGGQFGGITPTIGQGTPVSVGSMPINTNQFNTPWTGPVNTLGLFGTNFFNPHVSGLFAQPMMPQFGTIPQYGPQYGQYPTSSFGGTYGSPLASNWINQFPAPTNFNPQTIPVGVPNYTSGYVNGFPVPNFSTMQPINAQQYVGNPLENAETTPVSPIQNSKRPLTRQGS